MREFDTGATRDNDKPYDPEGFLSPKVLERYCMYMEKHRRQADGNLRPSDNWQKGIPLNVYMKSMWRHFFFLWKLHRTAFKSKDELEDASFVFELELNGILFNTMGYLHELLKKR